jgi:hypothetical protein
MTYALQPGDLGKNMLNKICHLTAKVARIYCIAGLLSALMAWAGIGGSISGTVKDPTGSVIP